MLSLAPANNLACHHFTLQCLPQEVSVHGQFATAVENYCVSLVIFNLMHTYIIPRFFGFVHKFILFINKGL